MNRVDLAFKLAQLSQGALQRASELSWERKVDEFTEAYTRGTHQIGKGRLEDPLFK